MNQDQQPRHWWKDNWLVLALVVLAVVIATITGLGYWLRWTWTGLGTKSAWDWLELLIIPIVLAAGGFWFNTQSRKRELEQELARRKSEHELALRARESEQEIAQRERENDREIAEDRAREDALQRYLDRMSELVLDKNLRESKQDDAVRATARARTLTVLRSLDGERKGQVVRFLYESDLIGKTVREESGERRVIEAIIDLRTADLRGAYLSGTDLGGIKFANLRPVDLRGADMSGADLGGANLRRVYLGGANLYGANLGNTYLNDADLSHTNLTFANLYQADLSHTNLYAAAMFYADLYGADLSGTNLRDANLSDAKGLSYQQLAQAWSLEGATMPDRTIMTEEAWEEFKKRYR